MTAEIVIPRLPRPAAVLAAKIPAPVMQRLLEGLLRRALARHPRLFDRLGAHADARFLIDPTDLPFVLLLAPRDAGLTVLRRGALPVFDARIAGSLAVFLGLVHAKYDGDALFFSRDLAVEGDTGAVLALRNAIDDAEIDMTEEVLSLLGPLRALFELPLRRLLPFAEQITGVALTRRGGGSI